MNLPEHAFQPSACDLRYGGYTALLADHTALVERVALVQRVLRQYQTIIERLRWEYAIQTGGGEFKFDNRFTSRLARVAVDRAPDLAGLFEFRDLRS